MITFQLNREFIALCDLLKVEGIAESGGQAKAMVAGGTVTVDGVRELRKSAKIRAGQVVTCLGQTIEVVSDSHTKS